MLIGTISFSGDEPLYIRFLTVLTNTSRDPRATIMYEVAPNVLFNGNKVNLDVNASTSTVPCNYIYTHINCNLELFTRNDRALRNEFPIGISAGVARQ